MKLTIITLLTILTIFAAAKTPVRPPIDPQGDPPEFDPLMIEQLKKLPMKERTDSPMLSVVAHSSDPLAVRFMLDVLKDATESPDWRREAFQHLAGTGGAEGVKAVRAARARPGRRKPWYDRIDFSDLGRKVCLTKQDAKGRTWALFDSAILGNDSDLFIAQKLKTGWGRPLFTGAYRIEPGPHSDPPHFRGLPIKVVVDTEWIRMFPDDRTIRVDSDGDGLTDLVEVRLGTNPHKPDSDGDGLSDAVDPCPNAAPRTMGDTEKVIAACIQARFFLNDWGVPAVIELESVRPFQLYGYPSTIMWAPPKRLTELLSVYGGGVIRISFYSADEWAKQGAPFISFSPDRKTARTVITRHSWLEDADTFEVTLKKIDGEWYVLDMTLKSVS